MLSFSPWCDPPCPTLAHHFWFCTAISKFWDQIIITCWRNYVPQNSKRPNAVHLWMHPRKKYNASSFTTTTVKLPQWVLLCLLTARRATLKAWTSSFNTSIVTVKKELRALMYIGKINIITQKFGLTKHFFSCWKSLMKHSLTSSEIHILMKPF